MGEIHGDDGSVEQAAPAWGVFGDLMSGLLGAFVLILVGVLGVQLELATTLEAEVHKRRIEEQRREALEKALAVQLFSESNDKLMASLQRIEGALEKAMTRSDEQLAYYVAQAREVIDLSISAQQGIVEDLRRLHGSEGSVGRPAMASLGGDA